MTLKTICFGVFIFQVVNSQFYELPRPSVYPYNYFYNSNYYNSPPQLFMPTLVPSPPVPPIATGLAFPAYANVAPKSPPKRSVATPNPATATAYYLTTPTDKIKASVISTEVTKPPKYVCPLCNGFADVPPNAKIPPPPATGSPVLPGILDKIPTILEDLKIKDPCSCLTSKPRLSDIYEKHKLPKTLSFDQELLDGFLKGLGL